MATGKGFKRGQTQVLFRHLPQAMFEHDDYGLCKVTSVVLDDVVVNEGAFFDAMSDALAAWANPRYVEKYPDPRDPAKRTKYRIGTARQVNFAPYPEVFICRKCQRTARFSDLQRRGATASAVCSVCGPAGRMTPLRYVQAHNCGRLEEIFLPTQRCPKGHGPEHLALYDPGRVKQARWFCAACQSDIQGLRMTPCTCAYSDSLPPKHSERWLRVVPTGDPALYIPHTVAFINFPEEAEVKLKAAADSVAFMLARTWGLLHEPVTKLLLDRERAAKDTSSGLANEAIEALRAMKPDHPLVKEHDARVAKPLGQDVLDRVDGLLGGRGAASKEIPRRWLVEHTTLMDKTSISTTRDVADMLRTRGDVDGATDIEEAEHKAHNLMGIQAIRVINDFPLALCAFGYTRIMRDPARTMLTPFPPDERGRIPIFALSSETEALWFQLDPVRVAAWLFDNGFAVGTPPADAPSAWAWVYRNLPGLRVAQYEPAYADRNSVAVRTLLHSMSHIFLRRIEWSGFSPSSVGEYLLPGSLSFILYANRYADTKIGGLTTLFEQRLNTWLWDAVQAGRECIYDPLCADDGGSCAGCTHREHNCVLFNRELSRATLYGGPTPPGSELEGVGLRVGFWQKAFLAAPQQ